MKAQSFRLAAVFAAGLLILALACDESETVAPDGSTISLAASPASILLSDGKQANNVTILGTLRNSIGVPLPGQDVRFTNTSGNLTPQAGTPVTTDDLGNALTILKDATQNTTISAQSGKATATLSIQSTTCNIASVAASLSTMTFVHCDDTFELTATVTSTSNDPCEGVLVSFRSSVDSLPDTDVQFTFDFGTRPQNTDEFGKVTVTVGLASNCSSKCDLNATPLPLDCNTSNQEILASSGGVDSPPVVVDISVRN